MNGRAFLETARFLRDNCTDEAAFRSAISRAYYACFLETRRAAFANCEEVSRKKAGLYKEKDIQHKRLPDCLKQSSYEKARKLGRDLSSLHGFRKKADYDLSIVINHADARDAVERAELFLKDFDMVGPKAIGVALEDGLSK